MSTITKRGLITGPQDLLDALPKSAFTVRSWQDSVAPKTQSAARDIVHAKGGYIESIFDAAHGFRYMAFTYRTPEERRACWAFHTGEKA